MSLQIGDTAPDFTADTSTGPLTFHDWIGSDWVFFFSHPGDFTPVCTTEIGRTAQLADAFAKRHVKPLGLSTDTVAKHLKWKGCRGNPAQPCDLPHRGRPRPQGGAAS
jgi:peroxiredoxin (alkyl hydroperoxide reductase subunit C)